MLKKARQWFRGFLKQKETESLKNMASTHSTTIKVFPLTSDPTKAWDRISVQKGQKVSVVTPMDPNTPIAEDKLRFVCISDTHAQIEKKPLDFVPNGDVLLHAGDFSDIGMPTDTQNFNDFLGKLPHQVKVVIAGNHELTFDDDLVANNRQYLERSFRILPRKFEEVLAEQGFSSIKDMLTNCIYLEDNMVDLCGVSIYGSPWQPEFCGWGFNLTRGQELLDKWNLIPEGVDILMTHGPPLGHGDVLRSGLRSGCVELLFSIQQRIKPKFHIFGHIHEDYGITTDGQTTFINASTCTLQYKPINPPLVFDFPIPEGHTKAELTNQITPYRP